MKPLLPSSSLAFCHIHSIHRPIGHTNNHAHRPAASATAQAGRLTPGLQQQTSVLISAYFQPINFPIGHTNNHAHRPAADLAVHDELGAAFRLVKGQGESLPAVRAPDGQRLVHAATVRSGRRNATGRLLILSVMISGCLWAKLSAREGNDRTPLSPVARIKTGHPGVVLRRGIGEGHRDRR